MAEKFTLQAPIAISRTSYSLNFLTMDWKNAAVRAAVEGDDGVVVPIEYDGPPAIAVMQFINTADFRTQSMHRRAMLRFAQDGKIPAGTVSGTPD